MNEERMNPNFNLESCLRNKVNEAKRYLEDKHKRQKDGACEESSYAESFIYYFQHVETILDLYKQEKEKAEEYRLGWCNTGEELEQEKEKNKELEKEMELNKEAIYLANNTICNYDIGYQDGLNKKMTATEIVAERRKFMILGQKINQLENANYELHKKIDEGNKKVVEDYISKDKIKEFIEENTRTGRGYNEYEEGLIDENDRIIDKLSKMIEEN